MPVSIKTPAQMNGGGPPPTLVITTTSLPNATQGVLYGPVQFIASGAVGTVTWAAVSGLPAGMTFSTAGVLTGTPTTAGSSTLDVTATDSVSMAPATLALVINPPAGFTITTTSLPPGYVNIAYGNFQLAASGGVAPLTWSLSSGTLPAGLSLSAAGVISGTPTAAGTASGIVIAVHDSTTPTPQSATKSFSLTIGAASPVGVVNYMSSFGAGIIQQLPDAVVGVNYIGRTTISANWVAAIYGTTVPAGRANTFALSASPDGLTPHPWMTFYSTGTDSFCYLQGTPPAGSEGATTVYIQATDTATLVSSSWQPFSLTVRAPAPPATAPWILSRGVLTSTTIRLWWYPTEDIPPEVYRIYRDGVFLADVPNWPAAWPAAALGRLFFYLDSPLLPNSTHIYKMCGATQVPAGSGTWVEGPFTPDFSVTTLAGPTNGLGSTPTTPPIPAAEPSTWVVPYTGLPIGTTRWLVADVGDGAANWNNGGAAGTPVTTATTTPRPATVTGCGLQYALNNCNPGEVIVMPAGMVYRTPASHSVTIGANISGAGGAFVYLISDQVPEYNPSGTLPPYDLQLHKPVFTKILFQTAGGATTLPAGTTSAVMVNAGGTPVPWTGRTQKLPVMFFGTDPDRTNEAINCTVTNGSANISWPWPLWNQVQAYGYLVDLHNTVTWADKNAMAIIEIQSAGNINVLASVQRLRMIGVRVRAMPGNTLVTIYQMIQFPNPATNPQKLPPVLPDHIYLDRCIVGSDIDELAGDIASGGQMVNNGIWPTGGNWIPATKPNGSLLDYGLCRGGINLNCDHFMVHQCYFAGIYNGHDSGGDNWGIFSAGGHFISLRQTYFEALSEGFITGGATIAYGNVPTDIVCECCVNMKPTSWLRASIGRSVKNHFETKAGIRVVLRNNLHISNWQGFQGSQGGITFKATAGDQNANDLRLPFLPANRPALPPASQGTDGISQWIITTDVDVHDNMFLNIGTCYYNSPGTNFQPACYKERHRLYNNLYFINPRISADPLTLAGDFATYRLDCMTIEPTSDLIIDHNTIIVQHNASINEATARGQPNGPIIGQSMYTQTMYVGVGTEKIDRATIINNVFDLRGWSYWRIVGPVGTDPYTTANFPKAFDNATITNNLVTKAQPNTTPLIVFAGNGVPLDQVGFANMPTRVANPDPRNFGPEPWQPPLSSSDWNVTTGQYATASTTGGPIGAISP